MFGTPKTPRSTAGGFFEGLRHISFSASRHEEEEEEEPTGEEDYSPQKTGLHRRASAKVENSWSPFLNFSRATTAAANNKDDEEGQLSLLLTSKSHSSDKDDTSLDDDDDIDIDNTSSSPKRVLPSDAAAGGEESNSLWDRGSWLVGLLILQSFSSFIIKNNEAMLQRHAVIVRFLTMLVGAGGNAGNQASVR
jgi:hypothetical protein